jgi:hypothetical protein
LALYLVFKWTSGIPCQQVKRIDQARSYGMQKIATWSNGSSRDILSISGTSRSITTGHLSAPDWNVSVLHLLNQHYNLWGQHHAIENADNGCTGTAYKEQNKVGE